MIIIWTITGLIFIPLMDLLLPGTLTWFTLFGLRYDPENGKTPIFYEESIIWIYFPLLDLNLPVIQTETRNGTKLISKERSSVIPFLSVPKDENDPVSPTSQSNSENDEGQKELIEGEYFQNDMENEFKSIAYSNLEVNPDPVVYPEPTTISIEIEVPENIDQVNITIDGIENSMTRSEIVDNRWEFTFYPKRFGIFEFIIEIENKLGEIEYVSGTFSVIPSDELSYEMLKRFVDGSTLIMTFTGIILSLFGVAPFFNDPQKIKVYDIIIYLLAIFTIASSIGLMIKNLYINFILELIEPGLDPEEILKSSSYFLGIIFGYFISMTVCYIVWLLSRTFSGKIKKEFLENNVFKGIQIGFGIGYLIINLIELIPGGFTAPSYISRLLGIYTFWLVFGFLMATAIFLTISLIAKKDNTTPKFFFMYGTCLGILSFIFLIIYLTWIPKWTSWATWYGISKCLGIN